MIDGFILAPDGRPMHTNDGNVIDPIGLLENYGTDAWRYYSSTVTVGEDTAIQEKDILHGQRFCTKLWNIHKFISKTIAGPVEVDYSQLRTSDRWLLTQYSRLVKEITQDYEDFRFDRVMRKLESFIWHVFADHYIEMVKHRMSDDNDESFDSSGPSEQALLDNNELSDSSEQDDALAHTLYTVGLGTLKMLAVIMPHISDEIYEQLYKEYDGAQSITISEWPEASIEDDTEFARGELLKDIISAVRNWKSEQGLALSAELQIIEIIGPQVEKLMGSEPDIAGTLKAKDVLLMAEADVIETPVEIKPVHAIIGPRFKQFAGEIVKKLAAVDAAEIAPALESGELDILLSNGETVIIEKDMVNIIKVPMLDGKEVKSVNVGELLVLIGMETP